MGTTTGARRGLAKEGMPRYKLHKTVALVGMMGSGKTAIGKALSLRLGVPFRDSDTAIEEAAQQTISEIFARDGEPFFREREAEVIARLLNDPTPAILSTGGGAFMAERSRQAIERSGISVWLEAPVDILWERVRQRDMRPLLRTADPQKTLRDLLAKRAPFYGLAALRLTAEAGQPVEETTERAINLLLSHGDVLEKIV